MKRIEKKLLLFLSDPDVSDAEFSELAHSLESSRLQLLLATAWELRKQLNHDPRDSHHSENRSAEDQALMEIERLLIGAARIPKGVAVRLLSEKLNFKRPLPSRFSFHSAVLSFIREFDASKVLSAAHQLRNEYIHNRPRHDWPLGER